jgi:hypothetical protein
MHDLESPEAAGAAVAAQEQPPPEMALIQMTFGFGISQALYVAAELGIADLLKDGPRTAAELASAAEAHPEALYRLLRALASVGVFAMDDEGRFGLTPISTLLIDGPGSMRPLVRHMVEPATWQAWGALLHSVRTAETSFAHANGHPVFDYYAANPQSGEVFHDAMTAASAMMEDALVGACDYSSASTIVDVGGGNGALLMAILAANEGAKGIVFDQPDTIADTRRSIEEKAMAARCEAVGGDFFKSVPAADTYVLKYILHDWTDEQCVSILRNIVQAAADDVRIVIFDGLIQPGGHPGPAALGDLHMMVMTGGRERTEAEFRALLDKAGLKLTRVEALDEELAVLEATRS